MSQEIHNQQQIQPETYTHGYGEEFRRFHSARERSTKPLSSCPTCGRG